MRKKFITKKVAKGMQDVIMLFQDKQSPLRGLTSSEFISLFYKLPIKKVYGMSDKTKECKWEQICTIKKYLIRSKQVAIVFIPLSRGTVIENNEFGRRVLDKRTNIFFKCTDISLANSVRKMYDTWGKAYIKTGNNIQEIAEDSQELIKVMQEVEITR